MATPDTVAVQSTGQTFMDLLELERLYNVMNSTTASPYLHPGWLPPALIDPNYKPPRRDEKQIAIGSAVGLTIATALVIYKIVMTQRYRKTWMLFLEDWLLALGCVSAYALLGVSWLSLLQYQAGWHVYDVHIESVIMAYRLLVVVELLTAWIYSIIRISLLLSIRRLYSPIRTKMRGVCDILVVLKIGCFVGSVLAITFTARKCPQCVFDVFTSMERKADPMKVATGVCANFLVLDIVILLSPLPLIPMLRRLSMRRKLLILAICFCGFFTIIASAARLWQLVYLREIMYVDMTWYFANLEVTNNTELVLAIVTCCLPTAKSFFRWAYKKDSFPSKVRNSNNCIESQFDAETSRYSKGSLSFLTNDGTLPLRSHEMLAIDTFRVGGVNEVSEAGDDDDNFYDLLEPSDSFFPSAIGLSPPSCSSRLSRSQHMNM